MRRVHFTWIAIAAGMTARLAWVLGTAPVARDDAANYRALAHALAGGRGYATSAGPTAYWTPGWPAWMALLYRFGTDRAVVFANVALAGLTIALVWRLARDLFSRETAWVAAAACALTPSLVLLPGVLLSENLALPLVVGAAWALVRARKTRAVRDFAIFGAAVAAATYVRESSAAFVLAGLVIAASNPPRGARASLRRRAAACAAVTLAFGLALAPWVLRNRAEMGAATLTTSAGVNLCIGLGDGATGGYRTLDHAKHPLAEGELARHVRGLRCAAGGLRRHPLELVTLAPAKLSRLVVWDDWIVDDFYARTPGASRPAMLALGGLCDLGWWVLLFAAVVTAWRERAESRVIVAFAGCVALSVVVAFGGGRFHTTLLPLVAVLAARHKWYRRAL